MADKNHDSKGRFAAGAQYAGHAAVDAAVGYTAAHVLGPSIRSKMATRSKKSARNVVAEYARSNAFRPTRNIVVDIARAERKKVYKNGYTPRNSDDQANAAYRKIIQEGAERGDNPRSTEQSARSAAQKVRGRFKPTAADNEAFNNGTKAARSVIKESTKRMIGGAAKIATHLPVSRKVKLLTAAGSAVAGLGVTAAVRHVHQKLNKFNTNHDNHGRFSGGASLRQGNGQGPITHSQTKGESWYRMGAKDADDASHLDQKHKEATAKATAFEAIHDPNNVDHSMKLSELRDKAKSLKEQADLSRPDETGTSRTFKQNIPKRGKVKHAKLMNKLLKNIQDSKASAIFNGKANQLIPPTADPKVVEKAYSHGAMVALHRSGVGEYDFHMSPQEKAHMNPLKKFILYTHRRLFDEFHSKNKGEFKVYHDQFGVPFPDKRKDKDGNERKRFPPMHEMVKYDQGELNKLLPEYDRACAMAHTYGPKLLSEVHKELKTAIKESAKDTQPGLNKGLWGTIGGALGGLAGGAATDGVGAEEGAAIGSRIGNFLSGAKAAYQGSRASAGIGAVTRAVKNFAGTKIGRVAGKTFNTVGNVAKHPFETGFKAAGSKIGGASLGAKGAKVGSAVDSVTDIASPVLTATSIIDATKKPRQPQGQM